MDALESDAPVPVVRRGTRAVCDAIAERLMLRDPGLIAAVRPAPVLGGPGGRASHCSTAFHILVFTETTQPSHRSIAFHNHFFTETTQLPIPLFCST